MKRKTVILFLSVVLAVSSVLTGCGGDDKKEAASAETDASSGADQDDSSEADQADARASEQSETEEGGDGDKAAEAPEDDALDAKASDNEETGREEGAQEEKKEKSEKKTVMYTTVNLILRKKGSMDAEKLEILPVNTKVTVLKKGKEWYRVKAKGKKGYVFAEYLTESKEEAKEAEIQAAEAEAQAAAQAAAAQAASQNTYTSSSGGGTSSGGGKTEVSREDYPDCDGSGHGYSEIHYSDGSTEIVEY